MLLRGLTPPAQRLTPPARLGVEDGTMQGHRRELHRIFQDLHRSRIARVHLYRPGHLIAEHEIDAEKPPQPAPPDERLAQGFQPLPHGRGQGKRTKTPAVMKRRGMQPWLAD